MYVYIYMPIIYKYLGWGAHQVQLLVGLRGTIYGARDQTCVGQMQSQWYTILVFWPLYTNI